MTFNLHFDEINEYHRLRSSEDIIRRKLRNRAYNVFYRIESQLVKRHLPVKCKTETSQSIPLNPCNDFGRGDQ